MTRLFCNYRLLCALFIFCGVFLVIGQEAGARDSSDLGRQLSSFGKPADDAVKIQVWTDNPPEHVYKPGDRVVIHFSADRDCYIMILNVSAKGDVALLFPNMETSDNFIKASKEYTVFGDNSRTKLVMKKGLNQAHTIVYASAEPFSLDSLKIPEHQVVFKLAAQEDPRELMGVLNTIAGNRGFNRTTLSIKGEPEGKELQLMGPSREKLKMKSVSDPPDPVTGAQGLKESPKE
jgi:hypothetical protein